MAAPERKPRTLSHEESEFMLLHRVREHFDSPPASCSVVAGAEAADIRRFTVQVKDRLRNDWARRWIVAVYFTPTSGGDPDATGNGFSVVTGSVSTVPLADGWYELLTDSNGRLVFDLEVAGAGTRYVVAGVGGWFDEFGGFAWT